MSTTSSGQQATDSINGKLTFEQDKNRIVGRDENNLIRLLILANGSDFVMRVAKDGFDATSADNDELIFNSAQNVFKIVATATVPYSYSGGTNSTLTIPHNLGYAPIHLVYLGDSSGLTWRQLPVINGWNVTTQINISTWISASTDTTNLYIRSDYVSGNSGSGYFIRYYLLQESAS